MLELRGRGATGARIGDALAIAEAHCADSGEGPVEAFGEPKEYAASVALSTSERPDTIAELAALSLPTLVGLAGMMLAFAATSAWQAGQATEVSWGALTGVVLIMALSVTLARWLPWIASRLWVVGVAVGCAMVAYVVLVLNATSLAFALPTPIAALASVVLLGVGVFWSRRVTEADPVSDPLLGDPSPRMTRVVVAIQPWALPVMTALGMLLLTLVERTV